MISADTVYQRVLAVVNKENRGYITPQEYNLLANQAQGEIFEQYFYDLNQYNRRGEINNEYANPVKNIKEKIDIFKVEDQALTVSTGNKYTLPENLYRLGTLTYNTYTEIENVQKNELIYINNSPLTKPSASYPVFVRKGNEVEVYPSTVDSNIAVSFIRKPVAVNWTYYDFIDEAGNGAALYNPDATDHQSFELHSSEEGALVNKILAYVGITIKQADVVQVAEAKDNKKITQEKS
jgi:hypothetical protein